MPMAISSDEYDHGFSDDNYNEPFQKPIYHNKDLPKKTWFSRWPWSKKKEIIFDEEGFQIAMAGIQDNFFNLIDNIENHTGDSRDNEKFKSQFSKCIDLLENEVNYYNHTLQNPMVAKKIFTSNYARNIGTTATTISTAIGARAEMDRLQRILDKFNSTTKPRTWRRLLRWGSGRSHRRDRRRKRRHGKTYKRQRHGKTRRQRSCARH